MARMKPLVALSFILASACVRPQLAHTSAEMAATASHRVAPNIVGATTDSPAGAHHYTAGAVVPHSFNHVAPSAPAVCTTGHQPAPVVTKHVKVPTPVHVDAPYSVHVPTPVAGEPTIGRTLLPYTHAVVPVEAPRLTVSLGAYQVKSENHENQKKTAQSVSHNMSFFPLLLLSISAFCM